MATRKEWNQGQWEESVQSARTRLATAFNSKTLELQWLNSLAMREQLVNCLHQELNAYQIGIKGMFLLILVDTLWYYSNTSNGFSVPWKIVHLSAACKTILRFSKSSSYQWYKPLLPWHNFFFIFNKLSALFYQWHRFPRHHSILLTHFKLK